MDFYLRKDVSFHDGSKFNADAVIANFTRMNKGHKTFYVLWYGYKHILSDFIKV